MSVTDPVATGKYWRCGKCSKLAPIRQEKCACGSERSASPGQANLTFTDDESGLPWKAVGGTLAVVLLLGAAFAISRSAATDPANSELARRIRERRERAAQPQVIYVPVQPTADVVPAAVAEPVPVATPVAVVPPSPDPPAGWVAPQVARAAAEVIRFAPQESEVDIKRRNGIVEFEQSMIQLSDKADRADVAWGRFVQGCHVNVTSAFAATGVADRDWIAVAYVGVTTRTWTDACAEAGAFFGLTGQVRDGMCVAEDRARMAWVLPGTRRELRSKYRLGWDGWDRVCTGL